MAFSYQNYTGDNATDTFAIPFDYTAQSEISVTVDGVAETGLTFPSAASVQLTSAPASGTLVQVRRTTDLTARSVDFASGSVLTEEDLDDSNIQTFHASQEAIDRANDSIALDLDDKFDAKNKIIKNVADPVANTDAVNKQFISTNLPNITTVAGISSDVTTVAGISSDVTAVAADATDIGTVSTNIASVNTVATNISDVVTVANDLNEAISEIETAADDLNEAVSDIDTVSTNIANVNAVGGDIANVNTVATNIADVNTVATDIADVSTVAGISSDVSTVSGISADVTTVAADGTDIGTVAGISANVTTVAGISGDVTTVAGIQSNVTTVAGNNANITTVAGVSSDITTVAGISADVTTVAADGTDIGTVATNISNVNTVASNNANINTVAGISSNVTTVAGISADVTAVAGDATDIGTVATDLAGSNNIGTVAGAISNVNAVGADIANVNTTAANIAGVNSFAERYRVGASDPTTSLDEGDLAYNSTDNALKYYDGTSWSSITAGLTDIVADVTPQLGGNLDTNGNDVNFGDNDKAQFGAGNDLQIYHDGSNSTIRDEGTGDLTISTNGAKINLAKSPYENMLVANTDGAVDLYYDNSKKLATTSTGVDVTGTVTAQALDLGTNNPRIRFDDSDTSNNGEITLDNTALRIEADEDNAVANSKITFRVDGNDKAVIDSSGNVGIGTSSPTDLLHLNSGAIRLSGTATAPSTGHGIGTVSGGGLSFYSQGSERMRIDSSNNVGIGTSSPSRTLHVSSGVSNIGALISSTDAYAAIGIADNSGGVAIFAEGGVMSLRTGGNTTAGSTSEAMRIDSSGNVSLGNGKFLQFKDSGGTARDVLTIDAFNGLNINSAGGGSAAPIVFKENGSEIARFDSSGRLMVGTTNTIPGEGNSTSGFAASAGGKLFVSAAGRPALFSRNGSTGTCISLRDDGTEVGTISVTTSGTTYNTTSDLRLKTDIEPIDHATDMLMAMNPVSHRWKADPEADAVVGFIAQEMQEIVPEAVSKGDSEDDMWSMDYGRITPVLVAALQDAHKKIEQLEQRIADMENN